MYVRRRRFVRFLSFERFKIFPTHNCASVCVIHASACVVYASSMHDYGRDTRRPSVLMRRNWFETAHVHVRPLTPHVHITHEPRTYHVHSTDIHWQSLTKLTNNWHITDGKRITTHIHWRPSNVRGILHRICSYASTCAICQWFVSDCKLYVRGSCVIHAWFVSDFYPRKIGQFLDKPNLCAHYRSNGFDQRFRKH